MLNLSPEEMHRIITFYDNWIYSISWFFLYQAFALSSVCLSKQKQQHLGRNILLIVWPGFHIYDVQFFWRGPFKIIFKLIPYGTDL